MWHSKCLGIGVGRYELWISMPHNHIPAHTHPNDDATIIHIFSNALLVRVRNGVSKEVRIKPFTHMFKSHLLLGSDTHWFHTFSLPLIFINIGKKKRQSPSTNFHRI